jgi:transcriptional regulator with XRE-family HTH domain/molybdate-binding protein
MDRIRALREDQGWSQSELAERAGVTRQLVGAVEAGRHSPNVGAAIGLARALGVTVEELFAQPAEMEPVFGGSIPDGAAVNIAQVGDRTVAVAVGSGVSVSESWMIADAVVGADGIAWLPDRPAQRLIVAGCDPVLGMLANLVERTSSHHLMTVHASTDRSIAALTSGRVHGALVHAPAGELPKPPPGIRRWHVASWQVGLASTSRSGPPSIAQLADGRTRVVQREAGAGSQRALDRALRSVGSTQRLPGPIGGGHLDVARRVSQGGGRAGITMEAAARAFGLGFSPLEVHDVELWIDRQWSSLPAIQALLHTLTSTSFGQRVALVGGYDLHSTGTERRAS